MHSLRSGSGSVVSDPAEIRRLAVSYYEDLFMSKYTCINPQTCSSFFSGFPYVHEDENDKLDSQLTLPELFMALMSLQSSRALCIDGLFVDFYKTFW